MKAFLKRYAAVACTLVCVLIIAVAWMGVRFSADAGTYRLDDIEGDRAYLDGINIAMELSDMAHTQHITLNSGEISHSYEYNTPLRHQDILSYSISQAFVEDKTADVHVEIATELESSEDDYELWLTRMTRDTDRARISVSVVKHHITRTSSHLYTAQVVTDVTVHNASQPFVFNLEREIYVYKNQISQQGDPLPDETSETPFSYVYTDESSNGYEAETRYNMPLYAEAEDGTVYFTPALRPYHSGTSAIYRVDEWGSFGHPEEPTMVDGYPCYTDFNAKSFGTITKLTSFPVDGYQMHTISLDVVNNRLCMLLVVDGVLTLRVYSTEGSLEHEAALFNADPAQAMTRILFSNQSGGDTMLCYYLQDISDYVDENPMETGDTRLCCIRLGEKVELMSILTVKEAIMRAAFIDGHWVLAETESQESYAYYNFNTYIPAQNSIRVLDSMGKTLYKGELVTDAVEDIIQYYLVANANDYIDSTFTVNRWLYANDISEE